MIRTLDKSMLNLPHSIYELAPLAAQHGIEALSPPAEIFEDTAAAEKASALMREHGLKWGLMPMPADFYFWDLSDDDFEKALEKLARWAAVAEKLGVRHAYNHVWSSSHREFDENFEWTVKRVRAVGRILKEHGVRYGLEFLGPHELRSWQKHEFVHSLAGVMAIADAADEGVGIAFDTFHWYCSTNGAFDDVLFMAEHIDRLVAVHLNDAVEGLAYDAQKDMQRRLPMDTGIINSRDILARFKSRPNDALYMIEPFEPARTEFGAMTAEEAVSTVAKVFARVEG